MGGPGSTMLLIVLLVVMVGLVFIQSRNQKKQALASQSFRNSLSKGDEVMTRSGVIGRVVEVDLDNSSVIIESQGTNLQVYIDAISKKPEGVEVEVVKKSSAAAVVVDTEDAASAKTPAKTTKRAGTRKAATKKTSLKK
jgi:preprotein translocase YajC subunit